MADQFTYRVSWLGTETEAEADPAHPVIREKDRPKVWSPSHEAMVRSSESGMAKVERYMKKAPGIVQFGIDKIGAELLTVQEFIDTRRGE